MDTTDLLNSIIDSLREEPEFSDADFQPGFSDGAIRIDFPNGEIFVVTVAQVA